MCLTEQRIVEPGSFQLGFEHCIVTVLYPGSVIRTYKYSKFNNLDSISHLL